ncbi:hypothetical protein ACA583_10935 [Lactiplantibacillus plantarum]|uniref:hypothetical protein n=1 Tax=Lactiplantibacillus plantarum TaxID=1590 RepID=UPI00265A3A75|nr:hypothetical protein [Lactiplantibacillus plantarum]
MIIQKITGKEQKQLELQDKFYPGPGRSKTTGYTSSMINGPCTSPTYHLQAITFLLGIIAMDLSDPTISPLTLLHGWTYSPIARTTCFILLVVKLFILTLKTERKYKNARIN